MARGMLGRQHDIDLELGEVYFTQLLHDFEGKAQAVMGHVKLVRDRELITCEQELEDSLKGSFSGVGNLDLIGDFVGGKDGEAAISTQLGDAFAITSGIQSQIRALKIQKFKDFIALLTTRLGRLEAKETWTLACALGIESLDQELDQVIESVTEFITKDK